MKKNYSILTSRELKRIFKLIEEQYGNVPPSFKQYAFISGKEKIYLVNRDIDAVDLSALRINNLGLYIAEVKNDQIRLSIEGAQLIGPVATKNICDITPEQLRAWLRGEDLFVDKEFSGFVILQCGTDFVGSGKYMDGKILNFVPKARRLLEIH